MTIIATATGNKRNVYRQRSTALIASLDKLETVRNLAKTLNVELPLVIAGQAID